MNVAEQCNCGQRIPLGQWCTRLGSGKYLGSLWTAAEAAAIYGCAAHRMGVAMNKLFRRRHLRLGPDDNLGRPLWLYCVWAFAPFFSTQPAEIIRKLWREQHAQREAMSLMAQLHSDKNTPPIVKDQLARAAATLQRSQSAIR
jgi:hypothetical protein